MRHWGVLVTSLALVAAACTGATSEPGAGATTTVGARSSSAPDASTTPSSTERSRTTPPSAAEGATAEDATTQQPTTILERPLANAETVLAVADLADCRGPDAEVADLVRSLDGTIVMPGDLANREGSRQQFDDCFLPLYGSELDRIYTTPGDNDYNTPGAAPYFEVTADRPGEAGKGWYVIEIGSWQLISLNSNCDQVGGCRVGSEQYQWLDDVLQQQSFECRIVMWHEPRFTSAANYSGIPRLGDFYGRLDGAGADILLVGHSHHYERLGPLAPDGSPDPEGIMNFTLGIGGSFFTDFGDPLPGSRVMSNEHRGLVRFTLGDGGYDWEFINVDSNRTALVDRGSADC